MTKEEKENIQIQYIKDFERHFTKQQLDVNKPEEIEYVKDIITKVFRLEIEELGYKIKGEEQEGETPIELEFVNELENNVAGRHCRGNKYNKIQIAMLGIYRNLSYADPRIRQNGCLAIFITVFHEIQHQRQHMLTRLNVGSRESMLYAKEFVLQEVLGNNFYHGNYERLGVENNANAVGYSQAIQLMNFENPVFLDLTEMFEIEFETFLYKGQAKHLKFEDGIEREDLFEKTVLADIIGKELLDEYPILKKEYEVKYNGYIKRIGALQLIKNLEAETKAISSIQGLSDDEKNFMLKLMKQMYYHMICRSMQEEMLKDINDFVSEDDRRSFSIMDYKDS